MASNNVIQACEFLENKINTIHISLIEELQSIELSDIIININPFLLDKMDTKQAGYTVQYFLDKFINSIQEKMILRSIKDTAIFINNLVFGGWKSDLTGIDLEFCRDGLHYIVVINSAPDADNNNSIMKIYNDILIAQRLLKNSYPDVITQPAIGCYFGNEQNPDQGKYYKFCGQKFWEFISGEQYLYKHIFKVFRHNTKEEFTEYIVSYSKLINNFTKEFVNDFCNKDGSIDWDRLVEFNSAK